MCLNVGSCSVTTHRPITTLFLGRVNKLDITSINPFSLPSLPFIERDKLPALAGIYFVLSVDDGILYIGQTTDFNNRWHSTNHHKYKDLIQFQNLRIAWLGVEKIESLLKIEEVLITTFKPICNTAGKTHKSVREEFRFSEELGEQLRKYAYEKKLKKVDIVTKALEKFFDDEGY